MAVASRGRQTMLPILHNEPLLLAPSAAIFTLSLALFGCGKTPDSLAVPHGTGASSGFDAPGAATNGGGSPPTMPFSCPASAAPGTMVAVPQSSFQMGCNASVDNE